MSYNKNFFICMCFLKYSLLIFIFNIFSNNVYAHNSFEIWIKEFKKEAILIGISLDTLSVLDGLKPIKKTITLDQNQPEFKLTFNKYLNRVISIKRIEKAKVELKNNKLILDKISKEYNVQSRFIISLWAIESDFGRNMGNFNLFETLITLAFDGRRSSFFRKELISALKIIDKGMVNSTNIKSGWAGAMGQCQFMPSSYLAYAIDGDKDGIIDIWNNKQDVFASIANYLNKVGWNNNFTWGRPVSFSKDLISKDVNKKIRKLSSWSSLGIKKKNGLNLPQINIKAKLLIIDKDKKNSFLVYDNFNSLLKWNRSNYFALSVGILSDQLIK